MNKLRQLLFKKQIKITALGYKIYPDAKDDQTALRRTRAMINTKLPEAARVIRVIASKTGVSEAEILKLL